MKKKEMFDMGQKAHPIALRQASKYRHQDTVWYSRRYRQQLAARDMALRQYIQDMSTQQHIPKPRLAVQHGSTGTYIYAYVCTPYAQREHMAALCYMPYTSPMSTSVAHMSMWQYLDYDMPVYLSPTTLPHSVVSHMPAISGVQSQTLCQWTDTRHRVVYDMKHLLVNLVDSHTTPPSHTVESVPGQWLVHHMGSHMEQSLQTPIYWMPIGVSTMWNDAGFVADEIVWFLERRVGFRRIKQALARMVSETPSIQGVRVAVSGRVGGRSKKSQRARCDVWKYGATPLHVFSHRIDYAQRIARTHLGTSGVSVWLVYRDSM